MCPLPRVTYVFSIHDDIGAVVATVDYYDHDHHDVDNDDDDDDDAPSVCIQG